MQKFKFAILILPACLCGIALLHAEPTITLRNNQPFPWRLPVRVHVPSTNEGPWLTSDGQPAQPLDRDILFIADMAGSATQQITLHPSPGPVDRPSLFKIEADNPGVRLIYSGQEMGRLAWGIDAHTVTTAKHGTNAPQDFDADFKPLPFEFRQKVHGPVFDQWLATVTNAGLQMQIELLAYADGFLDINAHLTNESADPNVKTYAAVVCRWEQPPDVSRALCYDNHIQKLGARDRSPFRSGKGRQLFTQRGVDWVRAVFKDGTTAAWLNDFAPSFTVIDKSTKNPLHAPRYSGANLSQLGQEVQTVPGRFYSITEIARSNSKTFANRSTENILPARGEGVSFSSRLLLSKAALDNKAVDQIFVAFAGYNGQQERPDGATVSFGVPSVRFGTSYFPYSTLGENFDRWKLPGMDRESFWPLAADTVLQWRMFAEDIRRDLRIAKAMGFQLIRLHHLELLASIPKDTRREYLDFLFGELRRLHLRALLDVYASPEQLAELVGRYRDVVDSVELENEILIWGIPLDRPQQWNAEYDAIKKAAPDVQVSLAGYNNTGMFNRLEQLGVKFDRIDLHSYIDSLEAIPSGRGYALALGSMATKIGKPPMISEWNWRALTRMSEAARAKVYPSIFDTALATRAIPDFYEFQFNETMAPNPRIGRGNVLRHYELLDLSRRPKLEAFEFMKLIRRYSAPEDPVRIIGSSHEVAELDEQNRATLNISVTNTGADLLQLHATVETSDGLKADPLTNSPFTLATGKCATLPVAVSLRDRIPGFYHVFVRLESNEGLLRYLWAEVRVPGAPRMDAGPELNFDFSKPVTVAYAAKATVLEIETAFALGQTLESATGMTVPILPLKDVPKSSSAHLIFVGSVTNAPAPGKDWLMVEGKNPRAVEEAGMNLILRYWKFAKDSAARRVGLARKNLPKGGDAAKLP
jgi:hypothetical protein